MNFTLILLLAISLASSADDVPILGNVGTVIYVKTGDDVKDKVYNAQLHFCVIDNGNDDLIYVGTKYGMWDSGDFDVSSNGKVIKNIKVKFLANNGVVLRIGDLIANDKPDIISLCVSRVSGVFK